MENMQTQITGILELNKPQTEEKQQTQITDGLEEESKNPKRKFDEKDISKKKVKKELKEKEEKDDDNEEPISFVKSVIGKKISAHVMEDVYGFEDQTKIEDVLAECEITRRDKEVNQTVLDLWRQHKNTTTSTLRKQIDLILTHQPEKWSSDEGKLWQEAVPWILKNHELIFGSLKRTPGLLVVVLLVLGAKVKFVAKMPENRPEIYKRAKTFVENNLVIIDGSVQKKNK